MSNVISGAEWKAFYKDPEFWPDGAYHDDVLMIINGVADTEGEVDLGEVDDSARLVIASGWVHELPGRRDVGLQNHFDAWYAKQTTVNLLLTVPKSRIDEVRQLLQAAGIEIAGGQDESDGSDAHVETPRNA